MDSATFKKFICDIEDIIFIENRIVTCVSLCQELKVHVNVAKQLLHTFVHKDDGIEDKVSIVYILGGQLKDGCGLRIKLVEKSGYEDAVSEFSKITTNHVYSIQKSIQDPVNFISLYHAYPHFSPDERKFCAIQPKKEVDQREFKSLIVEISKEPVKPAIEVPKPVESSTKVQENGTSHQKQKKTLPEKIEQPTKSNKGGGIAGMFSRQAEKKKTETSKKVETKANTKKPGSLSGFLQTQTSKSKKESQAAIESMDVDSDLPIKEVNNKCDSKGKKTDNVKENNTNDIHEAEKSTVKEKSSLKGKENRKKRKKKNDGKEENQKKRRRIIRMSSSGSEQSENDLSDMEMEPEPTPAPTAATDEDEDIIPPTPGRKRVRKQVDKTYIDDDGFVLTKKEYTYESCTDDEGNNEKVEAERQEKQKTKSEVIKQDETTKKEEDNKKEDTKKQNENNKGSKKTLPTKQRLSANSNNKSSKQQASIMNFFKKKNT